MALNVTRYTGLSRVASLSELAIVGETLFADPTPLDLCCFLRDCHEHLLFEQRRIESSVDARDLEAAREVLSKFMTQLILPGGHKRDRVQDVMFTVAEREIVHWTYGVLTWLIYLQVLALCQNPSQPVASSLKKHIFLTKTEVCDLSVKELLDTLDSLSVNFKLLAATVDELYSLLDSLERRASIIICQEEVEVQTIQELANFFIYFKRTLFLQSMWPALDNLSLPNESHVKDLHTLCDRYLDNNGFRKNMLRLFYVLSTRHNDRARAIGAHTAESRLQNQRTTAWYNKVQTDAYKLPVSDLLQDNIFYTAMSLNAVDMYMKSRYEMPWIQYFCFFAANTVEQAITLRGAPYPLICISDFGTSIYYKKQQSCVHSIDVCIFNWFAIVAKSHDNCLFKNIKIISPFSYLMDSKAA
mgnify:CR=1 FL=1|tara:strand:- start:724 stop:1965 length:1242 start_codon:yes stop_codon:yes gene_type:complete